MVNPCEWPMARRRCARQRQRFWSDRQRLDPRSDRALNYTDRLQAGTVWVNSHTLIDANLPFGGMKQSGTGRDFGPDWLDGWCETKSVCVRY